jgi:uncharacterized protein
MTLHIKIARPKEIGQRTRRILCIDGGGIAGAFPAAFLAALEQDCDQPLGRYFDLICGTSTGGIIAIGLALGMSAQEISGLYNERGPHIFDQDGAAWLQPIKRSWRACKHLVTTKYDRSRLYREVEKLFGKKRIGDAKHRLVVPAWDRDTQSIYIFKTAHHPRLTTDYKCLAIDAAMATAAAPTYLRSHRIPNGTAFSDGGVWANNPVMHGVVEAITILDWAKDDIRVLSVGCGTEICNVNVDSGISGLGADVSRLFLDGQSRNSLAIAKLLTGHSESDPRIFRVSPVGAKGSFGLDDTRNLQPLRGMGASLAREAKPRLAPVFLTNPAAPFEPTYKLSEVAA